MRAVWAAVDWIESALTGIAAGAVRGFACAGPVAVADAGECAGWPTIGRDRRP